jgi:hypothetical protein
MNVPIKVAVQTIHGKKYKEVVPDNGLLDCCPFPDAPMGGSIQ